jgi:hypothetical protein
LLVCAALLFGIDAGPASPAPQIVDARDYDSFWLWAGVRSQPALAAAKRIYLLQGEVRVGEPVRLVNLRPATPHVQGSQVWLVVRVGTLARPPEVYAGLLRENVALDMRPDLDDHHRALFGVRQWTSGHGCEASTSVGMKPRSATTRSTPTFCLI